METKDFENDAVLSQDQTIDEKIEELEFQKSLFKAIDDSKLDVYKGYRSSDLRQFSQKQKEYEIDIALTRLKSQRYAGTKYLEHASKAKYLFKVPTHDYLKALTGQEFKNYDEIWKILTTQPQILATSQENGQAMEELVIGNNYYCGKFSEMGCLNGYGFIIESSGRVKQGVFVYSKLDYGKEHLIINSKLSYNFTSKCADFGRKYGYYSESDPDGCVIEGYEKERSNSGEMHINCNQNKEFRKNLSNFGQIY